MPYTLPDVWTWDMWFADDGTDYHVFYLKASRALLDPNRRHFHVTVGHAVSDDLRSWREVEDALIASDGPAFDDFTTWTGSVVRGARRAVADVLHRDIPRRCRQRPTRRHGHLSRPVPLGEAAGNRRRG